ncbi:MAG: TSUP family transporter [Opitutaceae bacterium]|nr:TSUP family transporter [Opitutaceae bacterium]
MSLWHYPLLFATGLIAGLVDAMAGGGGIITVPVLLNLGLPAPVALGTNKLQASFGSVSAAWHYTRLGAVDFKACRLGIVLTLVGAVAGAFAVALLNANLLGQLIPWLLGAILLYTIIRPQIGQQDHPPRWRWSWFFTAFGLGLGFYDGFFGPGTGTFWTMALVAVQGMNFVRATGCTKVMNATSNLASLAVFLLHGSVHLGAGLTMGVGQLIGAKLGAGLVMKKGARFVRPVFLTMVTLTLARLIYVSIKGP